MGDAELIENCTKVCPPDCNDVRFSISKQEIPTDVNYQCQDLEVNNLIKDILDSPMTFDYFPFVYEYFTMDQLNETNVPIYQYHKRIQQICHEIMRYDVAVVKVRMETAKYMKTIKDRKLIFADKLAVFGKTVKILSKIYVSISA